MCMCIGYARRQCLSGGVWGEVDARGCVSVRAQQFLFDAESLRAKQVMKVHQLLYSISEVASFVDAGFGVSGGDLSAAARYLSEVVRTQVVSVHGPIGEEHHRLLEVGVVFKHLQMVVVAIYPMHMHNMLDEIMPH